MRFSFSLVPSPPLSAFGETIARAESWGYDIAWVPDQGFMQDPFVALSYLTTCPENITLGIGVTNPFQRHPIQIARAAAALADLRPGGFILGLGAGEKRRIRDRVSAPQGGVQDQLRARVLPLVQGARAMNLKGACEELRRGCGGGGGDGAEAGGEPDGGGDHRG